MTDRHSSDREKTLPRRFHHYRKSARQRGYSFGLTIEHFDTVTKQDCFYCGKPGPNGIDRKDNTVGYEEGNCVTCCTLCNHMKHKSSVEDFLERCRVIARRHPINALIIMDTEDNKVEETTEEEVADTESDVAEEEAEEATDEGDIAE